MSESSVSRVRSLTGGTSPAGMARLHPSEYNRVAGLLQELPINTLFARAVVEGDVHGRVYVDDPVRPQACFIAHPYGMSLLFGSTASESFRRALGRYLIGDAADRTSVEWLQVFPDEWRLVIEELLGDRLVRPDSDGASVEISSVAEGSVFQDSRVNFLFNESSFAKLRTSLDLPPDCEIIDDAGFIYSTMHGSVVPSIFWDTATDFGRRGAAFGVLCRGELASAAFASFVIDHYLELGIETVEQFRGRGLAVHACSALIDYCLERRLEPVWACRLGNVASYRLAKRIGFDPVRLLPYYRLPMRLAAAMDSESH
jgi:GNAT superfamily N-acetyltransferase